MNEVVTRRYLWEGQLRLVAELDGSGNLVSQFVYGTKVNVPEYMLKGGATYGLITDQLGSVRLVVNASTGAVAQRIDYDEFGVVTSDTNPGFTPFGFAGGLYDNDTKLVRFGARDYDAETGRWASKDPIGFGGGDANLYGYVMSDPIDLVYSFGLYIFYSDDDVRATVKQARTQSAIVDWVLNQFENTGTQNLLFDRTDMTASSGKVNKGGIFPLWYVSLNLNDDCKRPPNQQVIHEVAGHVFFNKVFSSRHEWDSLGGENNSFIARQAHNWGQSVLSSLFPDQDFPWMEGPRSVPFNDPGE